MSVKDTILKTIKEHNLFKEKDKVLVAVSGGADSVCLLDVLYSLKDELSIKLYVAHLNHMIRGVEADKDEEFVSNLCKAYGIKFFSKKTDVLKYAKENGVSTEDAGRKLRYDFFYEISDKEKINKIVTAHNKNDRAETVLMRILRGTGTNGIKGISYKREDGVVRPLLDVLKSDIEKYCIENNLLFCVDKTNTDNDYTRNRIRNELLPYLEENFNQNVIDTLVRFSEISSKDADFINGYTERLYERLNTPFYLENENSLHIDTLKMLEFSVKTRLINIVAKKVMGKEYKLSYKNVLDILDLVFAKTGAGIDLSDGLRIENRYGFLFFENKNNIEDTFKNCDFCIEVLPLNSYYVECIDKKINIKLVDPWLYKKNKNDILIDFDKLENDKLFIRNRKDGDKIVCFSDGKTKKIKSIFIDEKIEKNKRNKIPLLCTENEVVAIIGKRVSFKYKVNKQTRRALLIEYGCN